MTKSADENISVDTRNWQRVLEHLRGRLSAQQFETWFVPLSAHRCRPERLHLMAPNRFYADWLLSNYRDILTAAAAAVTGSRPELLIEVVPQTDEDHESSQPFPEPTEPPRDQPVLNLRLTFDAFVVGPSNRLAHAASLAAAESPGGAYNPLFIHGACGLGKTHLLQAVCHHLLERDPNARVMYLSCEAFVSDFIRALGTNQVEAFRTRYRSADVLVVDDIHFLANKERSQEEFFHTFNTLYSRTRQVLLSSDSPPADIPTLTERLVSRFKWGLVARLDPPSFETRQAIIRQKAEARGLKITDEVTSFLAERVSTNVRDLEGAVIRLTGYASLSGRTLDLELASEVLNETGSKQTGLTIESIQAVVAQTYKVKCSELTGKRRPKSIAYPRQVAMYLARKLTGKSLEEIGKAFGGRDHSTVLHACEKIRKETESAPQLHDLLERLSGQIQHGND